MIPVNEQTELVEPSELKFENENRAESRILRKKIEEIESVLSEGIEDDVQTSKLKNFALSDGGLVNDTIRRKVWPRLLGLDPSNIEPFSDHASLEDHPEYEQVVLDVKRSLKRFPPGIPYAQRVALQDQLTRLILRVIIEYPHLRYYQGYHDVAVTFLLVVGEDVAFPIMRRLSTDHLKDCMEPTMDKTSYLLNYIYPLIKRLHPALFEFLERSGVGTMFCLPWFLTWYGHSLNHYKDVVRLYDYFLASPPLLPLYLAAVIVVHRHEEVFSVECDLASVHCLLSQLPDDLPFETLLSRATELYRKFPPDSIKNEIDERYNKELQMRHGGDEVSARRKALRRREQGFRLWTVLRRMPREAARQPYRTLLLTATLAVGLYAYLRSDTPDFMFLLHAVR